MASVLKNLKATAFFVATALFLAIFMMMTSSPTGIMSLRHQTARMPHPPFHTTSEHDLAMEAIKECPFLKRMAEKQAAERNAVVVSSKMLYPRGNSGDESEKDEKDAPVKKEIIQIKVGPSSTLRNPSLMTFVPSIASFNPFANTQGYRDTKARAVDERGIDDGPANRKTANPNIKTHARPRKEEGSYYKEPEDATLNERDRQNKELMKDVAKEHGLEIEELMKNLHFKGDPSKCPHLQILTAQRDRERDDKRKSSQSRFGAND